TLGLPVTGAFYRIHAVHSLDPATRRTCQFADMSNQIACLVEASPCSIGFDDVPDFSQNANTDAIKVNLQNPLPACIDGGQYPLQRVCTPSCPAGQVCLQGTTCCTPATTCPAGQICGTASDGCGGSVACGTCPAGQMCNGAGTQCICAPRTTCPAG